jgi:hypothetical protein
MENNKPIAPVEHKSFLVWAILSTIFCCLPFGIPSIVYAAMANSKHEAGDAVAAAEANAKAKKSCVILNPTWLSAPVDMSAAPYCWQQSIWA